MTKIEEKSSSSIYIFGGLGNQLFQVSRALLNLEYFPSHKMILDFGLNYGREDIHQFLDLDDLALAGRKLPFARIRHSIYSRKLSPLVNYESDETSLKECLKGINFGYFQDYRSAIAVASDVLSRIQRKVKSQNNIGNLNISNEAIGLHIRQGDYLGNSVYVQLQSDYYLAALEHVMRQRVVKQIDIYSDSSLRENRIVEDIKSQFPHLRLSYHVSRGGKDIDDLLEMSGHSVFICANSTFSWWAGALNDTGNKTVIRPKLYFSKKPTPKFLYPSWWIDF
jgi:hypothetical protein